METKKAILAVSFGTSYKKNIEKTIGAVERAIASACPEIPLFRAFTSPTIRKKLWQKEKILTQSPEEMLSQLQKEAYTDIMIQPTFMITGYEYDKLVQTVEHFYGGFSSVILGQPVLWKDADIAWMAESLLEMAKEDTWVFMGHGTEHAADGVYQRLQECLDERGRGNILIGTAEGELGREAVLKKAAERGAKHIVLHPLLLVCGDHANNDMAGDRPDSWKSQFEKAGYSVSCVLKGLGEYAWMQERFARKVEEGIKLLHGCKKA